MRLKKLELFGFKSFAEKTRIDFEPGVTAIVGPNGCGKSNIADSIKWVLGEQRPSAMRGVSMEDVIFNGTNTRDPINIAEVSLTFSNESKALPIDYDEVTITRRVHRSGESEYLLNKTRVRLKDIQGLFHGTGVGTVSYSLIEQGKIDLILSTRPEDRRHIFEEAAGITRFKSKKAEALRKLEHTVTNLQRLNDVMLEVSRQIKSIERQARKAERYKERFERLKGLDVKNSYRGYLLLKNENNTSVSEKDSLKEKEISFINSITDIDKKVNFQRNRLQEIEEKLSVFKTNMISTASEIEKNSSRLDMDAERIKELDDRITYVSEQKNSNEEKIGKLKNQIKDAKEELEQIEAGTTKKNENLRENEELLNSLNAEIEEFCRLVTQDESEIVELASSETRISNELTQIKANLQNISARLRRLNLEKEETETENKQAVEKYDELKSKKNTIATGLLNLKNEEKQLLEVTNKAKDTLSSLQAKSVNVNHLLTSLKSKLNFLKDLKERFEGYTQSVKTLLIYAKENRLPFDGLRDSIANLIRVKEEYEVPMEIALGINVQSIVVETGRQAEEAIEFLKTNNLGWVNFLPLENFTKSASEPDPEISGKTLGSLVNFIEVADEYKKIVLFLLADAYLVKDTTMAKEVLRGLSADSTLRMITRNGEIITKRGLAGGSYRIKEEMSLIGREAKINKLQLRCAELEEESAAFKETMLAKEKELVSLAEKERSLQESIHQQDIRRANIESELNSVTEDLKKYEDEITLVISELEETQAEKDSLINKQQEDENVAVEVHQKNTELQSVILESQRLIEEKKCRAQETQVKIAQIDTELSSIDKLYANQADTCGVLEKSIEESEAVQLNSQGEITSSGEKIEQLKKEIDRLNGLNGNLRGEKKALEENIRSIEGNRQAASQTLKEQQNLLRDKQERLNGLRNNMHTFEVKNTECSLRIENLIEKTFSAYNVNLSEAEINIDKNADWQEIEKEIAALKKQLESMGSVNLVAIEEYEELRERFDFLSRQQQDLEEAKESLHKAIQKMNRTTTKMFKETFEMIRVCFEEFFKLLFGGGNAKLVLTEENNVLESGIEIIARPPGKKLQNITLMSGGEKALCAIALLFAVFKVKPSPFCVLDEIDAPLDESNVVRFSRVLSDFIKTSQFIIITHNKKTINMADVMYGITMEESGISKVVSVKFVDEKEEASSPEKEPVPA